MKIIIAKNAGFCMGVRRAVEMALDAPNNYEGPIYTLGPLIHNPQVLTVLEEKGISTMKDIPAQGSGTVLIRAHGVPPEIKKNLVKAGFNIVDATCPRVLKVQTIIRKYSRQGYTSIIVGDKDHSEVVGLLGHAGKNGYIASSLDELKNLPPFDQAIIVARPPKMFFSSSRLRPGQKPTSLTTKFLIPYVIPPKSARLMSNAWQTWSMWSSS